MSGWSCPHQIGENCTRLKCECHPGRPGCVLRGKVVFASEDDASPSTRDHGGSSGSGAGDTRRGVKAGKRSKGTRPKKTG